MWETPTWPPSIQMGVTAGIFLASILLKEMRYLVYIRYLWFTLTVTNSVAVFLDTQAFKMASCVSLLFLNITESCFSRFLLRI